MKKLILISSLLTIAVAINTQEKVFPILVGHYLGQKSPGITPEIFAPELVSVGEGWSEAKLLSPDLPTFHWQFSVD
jgi:hypothetical protein